MKKKLKNFFKKFQILRKKKLQIFTVDIEQKIREKVLASFYGKKIFSYEFKKKIFKKLFMKKKNQNNFLLKVIT